MVVAKIMVDGTFASVVMRRTITAGLVGATVLVEYAPGIWDGLTKTVVFKGTETKDNITNETTIEIPGEVLTEPGKHLQVGFFGIDADKKQIVPTIWANLGLIYPGADPSGDTSTDPVLPVWGQIADKVEKLSEEVDTLKQTGGVGPGTPGKPGADGEDGGYYTPVVTQLDEDTIQFEFTPSKEGMPAIDPAQIELPAGPQGRPGQPGRDGLDGKDGKDGKDGVVAVTGATVGQTVKISAVDENGVPTAWLPTDFPSGGEAKEWEEFMRFTVDNSETMVLDFSSNGTETLESKKVKQFYLWSPMQNNTGDGYANVLINNRVNITRLESFGRANEGMLRLALCVKSDVLDVLYFGRDNIHGFLAGSALPVNSLMLSANENTVTMNALNYKNFNTYIRSYENGIWMPSSPVDYIKTVIATLDKPCGIGTEFIVYVR